MNLQRLATLWMLRSKYGYTHHYDPQTYGCVVKLDGCLYVRSSPEGMFLSAMHPEGFCRYYTPKTDDFTTTKIKGVSPWSTDLPSAPTP